MPRSVTERERLLLIEQLVERESNSGRKNAFLARVIWCTVRLWLEGKVVMVQEDRVRASLQMPSTRAAQAQLRLRRIPALQNRTWIPRTTAVLKNLLILRMKSGATIDIVRSAPIADLVAVYRFLLKSAIYAWIL